VAVTRPRQVTVQNYEYRTKQYVTRTFSGKDARVIQHEMDHLEGIAYWDGISKLKFDMAIKDAKKRGFDYSDVPYKPSGLIILP
jgi:peptide deformylase